MNPREKKMAIGIAALVGLLAIYYLYDSVTDKFTQRERDISSLTKKKADLQKQVEDGTRAKDRITAAAKRSLPSNQQDASTIYYVWLLNLVNNSKFESPNVTGKDTTVGSRIHKTGTFQSHSFTVKGRVDQNMKQLVQFLYDFYKANHLQRIEHLIITPAVDGSNKLNVTIDVEAIALTLPGFVDRTDMLADNPLPKLDKGDLNAYQKTIGERNLFAVYKPPVVLPDRQGSPPAPPFDYAKYTEVSGIIAQNDEPQLWVRVKPTGDQFKLKEGDEFTVGGVSYKVVKIGRRDAVLQRQEEGKPVQVHVSLGGNLKDATRVPAEEL